MVAFVARRIGTWREHDLQATHARRNRNDLEQLDRLICVYRIVFFPRQRCNPTCGYIP